MTLGQFFYFCGVLALGIDVTHRSFVCDPRKPLLGFLGGGLLGHAVAMGLLWMLT